MLQSLREASKSYIAVAFIGLLVLSFAVWGTNDIFVGRPETYIAKVGEVEIGEDYYRSYLALQLDTIRRRSGLDFSLSDAAAMGLTRQVLDELTAREALLQYGRAKGLSASDELVMQVIRAKPEFRGQDGQFSPALYSRLLRQANVPEQLYIEQERQNLMRQQLFLGLGSGLVPPETMIRQMNAYANARRLGEYIALPETLAGEIAAPDETTLKAYVAENAARYTPGERRRASVLYLDPLAFLDPAAVSEAEVDSQFAFALQQGQYGELEKRELEQITFPDAASAQAARERLDAGLSFADLAAERGLTPDDIALGRVTKGDPAVPAAAFEGEAGSLAGPLEGPFGWVILRTVAISPGSLAPQEQLDEAKAAIREALARREGALRVLDEASKVQKAIDNRLSLEQVAAETGHALTLLEGLDAEGRDIDGNPVELPAAKDAVLREVLFRTAEREVTLLDPGADGAYFVLRVDAVLPPEERPFEAVRARAEADWMAEERERRLDAAAADLANRARAGEPLETLAAELESPVAVTGPVARDGENQRLAPETIAALFAADQGEVILGRLAGDAGARIVLRFTSVTEAGAEEGAVALDQSARDLSAEIARDIDAVLRRHVLATVGVEIAEDRLARVVAAQ